MSALAICAMIIHRADSLIKMQHPKNIVQMTFHTCVPQAMIGHVIDLNAMQMTSSLRAKNIMQAILFSICLVEAKVIILSIAAPFEGKSEVTLCYHRIFPITIMGEFKFHCQKSSLAL